MLVFIMIKQVVWVCLYKMDNPIIHKDKIIAWKVLYFKNEISLNESCKSDSISDYNLKSHISKNTIMKFQRIKNDPISQSHRIIFRISHLTELILSNLTSHTIPCRPSTNGKQTTTGLVFEDAPWHKKYHNQKLKSLHSPKLHSTVVPTVIKYLEYWGRNEKVTTNLLLCFGIFPTNHMLTINTTEHAFTFVFVL